MAKAPSELVNISFGETGKNPEEADGMIFESLTRALGLEETKPKKLLAALFARAMPVRGFLGKCREPDENEVPVLHGAWTYLKYGHVDSKDEYWGEY